MTLAQKHVDRLKDIKEKIKEWSQYFEDNITRYHKYRKAVFKTSMTSQDRDLVKKQQRPMIEINGLETYLSRLRGEFAKQIPSPIVKSTDPQNDQMALTDFIEGHLRAIQQDADKDQFSNEVWKDTLGGGFSVATVWTDYEHEETFDQEIRMGRVFDPTLCGFDPMARNSTKNDSHYCFELFPMYKEEAENIFKMDLDQMSYVQDIGSFNWFYQSGIRKIVLVCHFYEKKYKKKTLVKDAAGQTMSLDDYNYQTENWTDITPPPEIVQKRSSTERTIVRYTIIGNEVLDYKKTDFTELPYIFIDGNSIDLRDTNNGPSYQMTRPLVYHAMDMQRMKNFLAQSFLNEVQNMSQSKFLLPETAFPTTKEYQQAWLQPQMPSTLLYKQFDDITKLPNNPPTTVQRQPIQPEVFNAFAQSDEFIRNILSSFDPNVALNSNDISGKAVIEGVTQSNATSMPYMFNYLAGLNQLYRVVVDLIPKYLTTPKSVPVIDEDGKRAYVMINSPGGIQVKNYDSRSLNVRVETGVNFDIQKEKSVDMMAKLSQAFPSFGQFINTQGIGVLLKNINLNGIDELRELYSESQEQQQQQPPQPDPAMMALNLKQQEMQSNLQQNQVKTQIDQTKLEQGQQKLNIDKMKVILGAQDAQASQNVQLTKAQTERMSKEADLQMRAMEHESKMDRIDYDFDRSDE